MEISDAIAILTQDRSSTGIFTDFDGTLSPIVQRPEEARAVDGALEALADIARTFALVAIVSARPLEDLKRRAKVRGALLAGAYGRERSDRAVRRPTEGWETAAVAAVAATSELKGVRVERKGPGVALHFREAPERGDEVGAIAEALATEFGLELRPGRKVYDLTIPGPGKGEAIAALIGERSLSCALVAGDDIADVEAFRMLRSDLPDVRTLIVAVASAEAPDDLVEHADLVLEGPSALARFLRALADASDSVR